MRRERRVLLAGILAAGCFVGGTSLSYLHRERIVQRITGANLATVSFVKNGPIRAEADSCRRFLGLAVENFDGVSLGRVKRILVDGPSNTAAFVVIATGGIFGLGARLVPVPARALVAGTVKRGVLALDVTEVAWRSAPCLSGDGVAELADPQRVEPIYAFYARLHQPERRRAPAAGASDFSEADLILNANTSLPKRHYGENRIIGASVTARTERPVSR